MECTETENEHMKKIPYILNPIKKTVLHVVEYLSLLHLKILFTMKFSFNYFP